MIKRISSILTALCCMLLSAPAWAKPPQTLDELKAIQQQIHQLDPSLSAATVALVSEHGDSTGSGVIVNSKGLILTASHVVQGSEIMYVIFKDGKQGKARVLGANYTRDAAMAQIEGDGPYPFVKIGDSDSVKVGDFVLALGHSKGFDPTRRAPLRLGRMNSDGKQRFMISECTLIGGDSGGPLFNMNGQLIGIHSSIGSLLEINNHVPINAFKADWERLQKGEQWGVLGLNPMADPNTPVVGFSMAVMRGVNGVIVDDIFPGTPAEKAGLQIGDLVTQMGDRRINSPQDMIRELGRHRPGEKVNLTVIRQGTPYKAPITLGRRGDVAQSYNNFND